jgi:hypothetical protein
MGYFVTDGYGVLMTKLKASIYSWQRNLDVNSATKPELVHMDNDTLSILRCAYYLFENEYKSAARRLLNLGHHRKLVPSPSPETTSATILTSSNYSPFDEVCITIVTDLITIQNADSILNSSIEENEQSETNLLNSQLDSKLKQYSTFLNYLCTYKYWSNLSYKAQEAILHSGEMLCSLQALYLTWTDDLSKQQDERGELYLQERYDWIRKLTLLILQGHHDKEAASRPENLFTSVTSVGKIIATIHKLLHDEYMILPTDTNETKQKKIAVIHASGVALATILSASSRSHEEFTNSIKQSIHIHIPYSLWEFEEATRNHIKGICWFIATSITSIPKIVTNNTYYEQLLVDLFHYLYQISREYLRMYADFLNAVNSASYAKIHSNSVIENEQIRYISDRNTAITLLGQALPSVQSASTDVLYQFAAEFGAFRELIDLCDAESSDSIREARLIQFLTQFGESFAQVLMQTYFEQNKIAQLFNISQPIEYFDWISKFFENKPFYRWLNDWHQKRYQNAAETLLQIANDNSLIDLTLHERKSLLSMSKLSFLVTKQQSNDAKIQLLNQSIHRLTEQIGTTSTA